MSEFGIGVALDPEADFDAPRQVKIEARDVVLTRLLRPGGAVPDDALRASPGVLAWWLVDHWWRLRWESVPPSGQTAEWRLAHDLSSVGGGFAWPRLVVWSEGERIGCMQRADPVGVVGPVRFVTEALVFVAAADFEAGIDDFLDIVSDPASRIASDWAALGEHAAALRDEREDVEAAAWRRLEAQAGYDPDEAPEALIEELLELAHRYGAWAIAEATQAAPGPTSAVTLRGELAAAKTSGVRCSLANAVGAAGIVRREQGWPPWMAAEAAALAVRSAFDVQGPLRNARLADVLGTTRKAFASQSPAHAVPHPYGLRVSADSSDLNRVALRARASHDRRFELARALGDAIWAREDALGPIARTRTARQKFQRAFAQSLLCPFDELREYLNLSSRDHEPSDEDVSVAAHHFHVSETVIRTLLVNKGILPRDALSDPSGAAMDADVEAYTEAA